MSGPLTISNTNESIGVPGSASLVMDNPSGSQTEQAFTFGGVPKASIRADSNGNLVLNASGSEAARTGFFYLNWDSGDPIAHIKTKAGLIVDVPTGGLTVDGALKVVGSPVPRGPKGIFVPSLTISGSGITFADGTIQNTATLVGPQGPQGPQGVQGVTGTQGTPGAQGAPGTAGKNATTKTFAVCTTSQCLCGNGLIAETAVNAYESGCSVTSDTGSCSVPGGTAGACCVCVGR